MPILVESQAFSPTSDKLCLSELRNSAIARQVFCPLNLTFSPHKRQLPCFPVFPGFTGVREENMLRSSWHFLIQLSKISHIARPRLLPFRAQTQSRSQSPRAFTVSGIEMSCILGADQKECSLWETKCPKCHRTR